MLPLIKKEEDRNFRFEGFSAFLAEYKEKDSDQGLPRYRTDTIFMVQRYFDILPDASYDAHVANICNMVAHVEILAYQYAELNTFIKDIQKRKDILNKHNISFDEYCEIKVGEDLQNGYTYDRFGLFDDKTEEEIENMSYEEFSDIYYDAYYENRKDFDKEYFFEDLEEIHAELELNDIVLQYLTEMRKMIEFYCKYKVIEINLSGKDIDTCDYDVDSYKY